MKINRIYLGITLSLSLVIGYFLVTSRPTFECANTGNCPNLPTLSVDNDQKAIFQNQEIEPPKIDLAAETLASNVLGDEAATGEKHIYVDLANQTLTAFQGDTLFMTALVSTGKWGRTPPGEYTIWVKMRSTKMSGGSGADYYYLPNVPYVMFFYNQKVSKGAGYSFHGAYWHNNFGHAMSHGCVNMRQIDAEKLFNWATPTTTGPTTHADANNTGTKVTIF